MKIRFADSFFFIALLSARDAAHEKSTRLAKQHTGVTLTTAWILAEVADGLSAAPARQGAMRLIESLRDDDRTIIVPPSQELFDRGMLLYSQRPDKDWSLTDCISFLVMEDYRVAEAFTADRHFEQAGFVTLL